MVNFLYVFFEIYGFKEIRGTFLVDFVDYLVKIFDDKVISETFWKNCS